MFQYTAMEVRKSQTFIGRRRQTQGSVASIRIFSLSVHWNEGSDGKNTSCKCLVRNPGLEEDVSIHRYGSEEIPDVIGCRRQTQGSLALTRIFFLFQCIKINALKTKHKLQVFSKESRLKKASFNTLLWKWGNPRHLLAVEDKRKGLWL